MRSTKIYYDPLGRPLRTVNPDLTEQRVVYGRPNNSDWTDPDDYQPSPWERFSYDANDLAPLTHPLDTTTDVSHYYTPKSERIDALGRTVQTTEHKGHYNVTDDIYEDVVMQYQYNIKGQLKKVIDPENREVFIHKYDTAGNNLWTEHLDSGIKTMAVDAMGKLLYSSDVKGAEIYASYDELHRPVSSWAKDKTGDAVTMRGHQIYGDASDFSEEQKFEFNIKGKMFQSYDEAGYVFHIHGYDYKNNPLGTHRRVLKDQLQINDGSYTIDWTGLDTNLILDPVYYQSKAEFDGLNRIRNVILPTSDFNNRPTMTPTYNRAGSLASLKLEDDEYIKEIAYNAKGQRLFMANGNDMMTRYDYRDDNFRLNKIKTEGYTKTDNIYSPVPNSVRQDLTYHYDLKGNIIKLGEELEDVGMTDSALGANAIEKYFSYDPINRLLSATGRESNTETNSNFWGESAKAGTNNASNTRSYSRSYEYDKVGNIQKLKHQAIGFNFTRGYNYISGVNQLQNIDNNQPSPNVHAAYEYDAVGNQTKVNTERFYEWDVADQLKYFKIDASGSDPSIQAQYHYAGGERVKKETKNQQGETEVTIYIDGLVEHRYKKNSSGVVTEEQDLVHIMDGRSRIATHRQGDIMDDPLSDPLLYATSSIKYNLEDHLGTSTVRLKEDGELIDREEYYPFGDSSLRTFTNKRYRYVGKELDSESGLYYYGARYYSAWTCRFISIDPLADKYAQLTPYNYADNNPIGDLDIDGMQSTQSDTAESVGMSEVKTVYNEDGSVNFDKSNFALDQVNITGIRKATQKELDDSADRIGNYFDHVNNMEIEHIEAGKHWQLLDYGNSQAKDWNEYYQAKDKFIERWNGDGSLEQAFDNYYPHTETYKREKRMEGLSLMNWGTWFAMALESGPGYTIKLQAPRGRINFKLGGEDALKVKLKDEMVSVYRGGDDFTLKPDEFRVTPNSPKYPARGLSVSADPTKLPKHLSVNKLTKAPKGLDFIHTPSKRDGLHFDIIPSDLKIGLHEFQKLLNQIKVTKQ